MARMNKLSKKIEATDVIFNVLDEEGDEYQELTFNFNDLPKPIQDYLGPFGLSHKLGDAAASADTAEERISLITKVWESLKAGEWSVRRAAEPKEKGPKISKKAVLENMASLSESEQEAAKAILAKLGFKL